MIDEALRLLGSLDGKRVLELGFAENVHALFLAEQGARVVAVDPSGERLAAVRQVADETDTKLELHQAGLAELAFLRAESVDLALSDGALADVDDLDRVFRQVHRVLRQDAPLVICLPHPAAGGRPYFEGRTIGDLFTSLARANFRVDALLEPEPTLVLRARKLGT